MERSFGLLPKSKAAGTTSLHFGGGLVLSADPSENPQSSKIVQGPDGYAVRVYEPDVAGSPSGTPGSGFGVETVGQIADLPAADVAFEIKSAEAPHFRVPGLTSI